MKATLNNSSRIQDEKYEAIQEHMLISTKYSPIDLSFLEMSSTLNLELSNPPNRGHTKIWNFLNKAKRDIEIITHVYKNGFPALDLLHINDLRQAILLAMDKDLNGSINLGTGVGTTTAEIAEWIVEKTKSSSSIRHQKIDNFVGNIIMDNSKAQHVLGWKPVTPLKEGLQPITDSIEDKK